MSRLIAAAILPAAFLAGCSDGPDEQQVLAEADRLARPLPGLYRSTTVFENYELPASSALEAETIRERMTGLSPQVREFCMTPKEAEGGFREMLSSMQEGDCAFESFSSQDGRLDARMRCNGETGIASLVTMAGEADPIRSTMRLEIEQSGNAVPGGTSRMVLTVESRRIGDCPAGTGAG